MVIVVLEAIIVPRFLEFLWHGWEGDALGQVRQWIDEASLLGRIMEEGAAFTKLALTGLFPVLA